MGYRTISRFVYDSSTAQAVDAGGSVQFPTATATSVAVANLIIMKLA